MLVGSGHKGGEECQHKAENDHHPFGQPDLVLLGTALIEHGGADLEEGPRYYGQAPGKDVLDIADTELHPFGQDDSQRCHHAEERCDEQYPAFRVIALHQHGGEEHGFRQLVEGNGKEERGQYRVIMVGDTQRYPFTESMDAEAQHQAPLHRVRMRRCRVRMPVLHTMGKPLQQDLQEKAYGDEQRRVPVIMMYIFRDEVHQRDAQQEGAGKGQEQGSGLLVPAPGP